MLGRGGCWDGVGRKTGDKIVCGVVWGRWGCSQGHQEIRGRLPAQQGSWAELESIHSTLPPVKTSTLQTKWTRQVRTMVWSGWSARGQEPGCHCDGLEGAGPATSLLSSPCLFGTQAASRAIRLSSAESVGSTVDVCVHTKRYIPRGMVTLCHHLWAVPSSDFYFSLLHF